MEENEQMGTDRDPGDTKPTQPRDPKMQVARILLPDGVHKEFEVNKTAEGEALFQQVTQNLSIEEREYFSLCFYDNVEGVRHWLYNDKVIAKQIKSLPWEFSFEVKFYPTTPTTIVDDHARYFVFLQLRRDILTGRLPIAQANTHSLLGSFVAQMEFGDAPSRVSPDYEKFITESKLVPSSYATPETFAAIAELHRELRGRSTSEAEIMYLDHCKHLPLYGIHIFKVTDKDKKPTDVGIGAAGINIYQDEQVAHAFIWQNIIKIGYKRTYFSVKVKAGAIENVKDEKTLHYKLPTYVAAKRVWKCAVEHHTFFRLIQPDDKPLKSFFHFGSGRFRYHGRTQFQTKIASQMFDKPSTVDRAPSAMSQPISGAEDQKLQTLNLTDSELEQRQFERYRRALTPKSYTSSRQDDDAISTATFAKYSRPSTLLVVNTSQQQHQPHDLSYSPRDDSSNYSSAAYYMSERSSLRTPSSAYYPPSEYTSPTSPVYFEGQHSGEYHVQMRQSTSAGASTGARRNLFGRASDARSSKASRDSVRLVSFHEPVDPDQPIHRTHPANELQEIPINHTVAVYYHGGAYERLSPRRQQRPELPYGFGNYTPRNGVSHVDNLQPDGEMDQQPIRFFVDVRHSGASRRDPTKRLSHPGKEDVKEKIDPKDYEFAPASTSDTLHRTELGREVQPANIHQFTRRYHPGQYSQQPDSPQYRLITHVHPLVVSTREESKNGQSSSNVTATISQKEQIVSTKVRRESPDADRRVRLSASVDRSGNLTDTTEEMARSSTTTTEVTTTTTTVVTTAEKKKKKQKIPPFSKKTDETRSRFGGFFTKKTSQKASDYPEESGEFSGELDTTARTRELESSDFQHPGQVPEYSPKKTTATVVTSSSSPEHHHLKKEKRSLVAVETPEVPKKYRLIARERHEGEEEVGDKPEAYDFSSPVHEGPVEDIRKETELVQVPIREYTEFKEKETSPVAGKKQKKVKSPKKTPVPAAPAEPTEPEKKEIKLIARVRTQPEEPVAEPVVKEKKPKKESSSKLGFFSKTSKTSKTTGYPESSDAFTGELDTTDRSAEFEPLPFEHTQTPTTSPHHHHKKFTLFGRLRHEGDEDVVEKPDPYAFESTSYSGPFEETHFEQPLEHVPIEVKHTGESWNWKKPAPTVVPLVKKEKKQKKVQTPVTEEPEKKEIKLIARVISGPEEPEPVVKEKKPKKESSSKFGFFSKTTKTTKTTSDYPESSAAFTGELDTTDRSRDLESSPFDHPDYPEYVPKKGDEDTYQPSEHSSRHDEETVEAPAAYGFPSTSYDGPLETTVLEKDLEHSQPPHTIVVPLKKSKKVKKQIPEPETREVRLVARYLPTEPVVEQQKSKTGFFTKKTTKTTSYPETTEAFTGKLEATSRTEDLPFEHQEFTRTITENDPVVTHDIKRYYIRERVRHEGEEDVVEKPDPYGFSTDIHVGPLDDIARQAELDHADIKAFTDVQYPGESWNYKKPAPTVVPLVKKQKKVKSPEPVEPETREVRLVARVVTETEDVVKPKETKPKKETSKSKLPALGFFSRTTKTTKTTGYPESSEAYTGELDTTNRSAELEGTSFEHPEYPAYAPKQIEIEAPEVPEVSAEPERKRYRLIARWRHEGEEDVADKPDAYAPSSKMLELYEGPLDEITRQSELDHADIKDYTETQYPGESWNYKKPAPTVVPLMKEKKIKSPKKETVAEPVEPETREIRLIAHVKSETEEDSEPVKEKSPKKSAKITGYPETSEQFSGELDTTSPSHELESSSFEHGEIPAYSPKKAETTSTPEKKQKKVKSPKKVKVVEPVEPETKEIRLIAHVKTEQEEPEPVVEEKKPKKESSSKFGFFSRTTKTTKTTGYPETSEAYTGELDTTTRSDELEGTSFEHPEIPEYSLRKADVEAPETAGIPLETEVPEKRKVRLIAYVKPEPKDEEPVEPVEEKKPKKEKSSKFGFFSKTTTKTTTTTTTTGYPSTSEAYTGELDTTSPSHELESTSFEHGEHPEYLPKNRVVEAVEVRPHSELKRYRLITRLRHEGVEDVVEKPEAYKFSADWLDQYDGPLDEISHSTQLEEVPLKDYTDTQYPGESWNWKKTPTPVATLEKKEKKIKSPKKVAEPEEPETKEIRLKALVKSEEPAAESAVKEKKPKKESSKFGFFSKKTTKPAGYPETSEAYTGDLGTTNRTAELEGTSFEHPEYPAYAPKKIEIEERKKPSSPKVEKVDENAPAKLRLLTIVKSDSDEDVVSEAPAKKLRKKKKRDAELGSFGFFHRTQEPSISPSITSEPYLGDVETIDLNRDLESTPLEHPASPVIIESHDQPEKKRFHWFARWRHEGEEDIAEKPDVYTPSSKMLELYEGPLDEIARQSELEHADILGYSETYHSGESWNAEKKPKSPKKQKSPEPEEPETREVRLVARIRSETEEELAPEPIKKKRDSKSALPGFGFFHRTSSTSHPETSEQYTGHLESTGKALELETAPFEHREIPAYSPKQIEVESPEVPAESEKKRFHWFARWRHEGEEDIAEKPDAYTPSAKMVELYEGPLDVIAPESELGYALISDHSDKYHSGESWNVKKTPTPVATLEKKEKKIKSPKKEKVPEPEEPEVKEIRLIARVKSETEEDLLPERLVKEKSPKKSGKITGYPEPSEQFSGELDTTSPTHELESSSFEHGEIPAYSPKKNETASTLEKKQKKVKSPKKEKVVEPIEPETKEIRLIAHVKTEQEEPEPVVEEKKPKKESSSKFGFFSRTTKTTKTTGYPETSEAYTGELDTTIRSDEFEGASFEHPDIPEYSLRKADVEAPETAGVPLETGVPEKRKVRLIAYVKPEPKDEQPVVPVKEKKPKKEKSSKLGFFSKTTKTVKTTGYPESSEAYTGELDTTDRTEEFQGTSFEHAESPSKKRSETPEDRVVEKKKYRLIARYRHDGEEDEVEKPEFYDFSPELYSGPLEETMYGSELAETPLGEHIALQSVETKEPVSKAKKSVISEEPETREVRLIARVKTQPEEEPVAEPIVKEKKPKKESSSKFGFFSKMTKTTKTTGYPESSEAYTGDLDTTDRSAELEGTSFEHPEYPEYAPKNVEAEASEVSEAPAELEKKRYRLIARWRHEGEEDVADKPDAYTPSHKMLELYEGPLDEITRQSELDHADIKDFTDTQYPGESWNWKKPAPTVVHLVKEKKTKSPKKEKVVEPEEPETKEIRLKVLVKSETEEEPAVEPVVKEKKPKKDSSSKFGFFSKTTKTTGYPEASDAYTGDLDTTNRSAELEGSSFEHPEYPAYAPKKSEVQTSVAPSQAEVVEEPEKKEIRLKAYVKTEEPVVEPVVKGKKPKKESSKFGFFSKTTKSTKTTGYPESSEVYSGELDTTARSSELEGTSFEHPEYPEYAPRKIEIEVPEIPEVPAQPEKKRYRLIARWKHEGEEDVADKPDAYTPSSTMAELYEGPLDEIARQSELDHVDIKDFTETQYPGESWNWKKPSTLEKKEKKIKSPKKETVEEPEEPETREVRLVARIRSETEEELAPEPIKKKRDSKSALPGFGFFHRTSSTSHPETSEQYTGHLESTGKALELETAPFEHREIPAYSPKQIEVESPEVPAESEKKRFHWFARWRHEGEEDIAEKPDAYTPSAKMVELYEGPLDVIAPESELGYALISDHSDKYHSGESWNVKKTPTPVATLEKKEKKIKSPKKEKVPEPEEPEVQEIRLIARVKSETEEDLLPEPVVKEKSPKKEGSSKFGFFSRASKSTKVTGYPETSEAYTGDLDTTGRSNELESSAFEHPEYPAYAPKKVEAATSEVAEAPTEPERQEIRLIAYVKPEQTEEPVEPVKEEKPKKEGSSRFGFFSKTSKTTKTTGYPESSEAFTGDLDTTGRSAELETSEFEHPEYPPYKPRVEETTEIAGLPEVLTEKKKYRLIARFRHAGEEDVVEKPEAYGFPTDVHVGPIDDIHRVVDLDQVPLGDYLERTGESWKVEELTTPIATLEKKQKKAKSPKKEKTPEPVEPERKEIKLIARVRTEPEEPLGEPVVKDKKPKKESSSRFGFFSKTTKTTKTTGYPETSEAYTGDLDTTNRSDELEGTSFEHPEYPAYAPKKIEVEASEVPEVPTEPEKKRYRLIARWRHEGEEDVADKPDAYTPSHKMLELYEGPLDEITRQSELDHADIKDFTDTQYPGESWNWKKPAPTVVHLVKEKKTKSPKKEKVVEPEEPETKEIRLKVLVKSETEEEPAVEPVEKEKKPKKDSSSKFGFFSKTTKTTKTTGYPEASDTYTGDLDTTNRSAELEGNSFEHPEYPAYAPKMIEAEAPEAPEIPAEPERKRYRLIARWRHEGEEDVIDKPEAYTPSSKMLELYEGPLDEIVRQSELDHSDIKDFTDTQYPGESWNYVKPSTLEKKIKSPKKEKVVEPVEPEKKEIKLIARVRTEPEEPVAETVVKEKKPKKESSSKFGFFSKTTKTSKTTGYPETSEAYTGDLNTTDRTHEFEGTSFEHGEIPAYSPRKAEVETTAVPEQSEKVFVPEEPEKTEVRLIVHVKPQPEKEPVAEAVLKENKPKKESSSKIGFFSKTTKTVKTTSYPEASEAYTGELDTTGRSAELERSSFEHPDYPAYAPKKIEVESREVPEIPTEPEKKRYKLIARYRHEGEEDVVHKPDPYAFDSTLFAGPLEEISRENELDHTPIADHADIRRHEEKKIEEPVAPVRSHKKEKIVEPEEPETKEIRLKVLVKSEAEEEPVIEKPKKEASKTKRPSFGFFSRTTKTTKTTGYPESSEAYTGELDTTNRSDELEGTSFEHPEYPAYAPKKIEAEAREVSEVPAEPEKKRYRLIARWRHEGEEDVADKPDAYAPSSKMLELYEGPLDEITRQSELDHADIKDYTETQYPGESWNWKKTPTPVATLQKKVKSPKKEKVVEPVEPEKKVIKLIARVRTEPEEEAVEPVKEKKPKKESSSKFGFFSKTTKTTKTTGYPESHEPYTGDLDTTNRSHDLEGTSFEHPEYPAYAPKKIEVSEVPEVPAEPEKKRYRLIARFKHEGEEDVTDKPESYTPSSKMLDLYEGPLDEIARQSELDHADIKDFTETQYPGESWNYKKPAPTVVPLVKEKMTKSPKKEKVVEPEEPETKEIRLKVLVKSETEEEPAVEPVEKEKKPKKDSSSKFGFFSRTTKTTKTTGYPESSEAYTGDLDTTDRTQEFEGTSFEHREIPSYSAKKIEVETPELPAEVEKKRYRLIARFKHEGEEDVADKPDAYTPSPSMVGLYEGSLDEIAPQSELDQTDIKDFIETQYPGESWNWKKPSTLEKKEKKIKSPKKEKTPEPIEPEKKEIRLIAYVKKEPEEEEAVAEPVKEKKPKKESSKFGFFSKTTKTMKTTGYPVSSEAYTGELDTTDRSAELEGTLFEHPEYPAYAPKKIEVEAPEDSEVPAQPEKKRYRLIARFKHEGEEDVADKPDAYTPSANMLELYEGPLDVINRQSELDHADIKDFTDTQYPGESWNWKKPAPIVVPLVKKKKTKSPKKETAAEPVELETKEIRLKALVKSEPEEPVSEPVVKEKKPKKESSSKFGFFSKTAKTTKETEYPVSAEAYTGDLAITDRSAELEGISFEHPDYPEYAPKRSEIQTSVAPTQAEVVEEPEKKEIRLKAYVKSEPEEEPVQPVVKDKKPKKEGASRFGFFSKTTKTTKTTGYPQTSEAYTGDLDTTDRTQEFEGTSFEHGEIPAYSPSKVKIEAPDVPEVPAEPEKKRFHWFARWRHEGEEDVADKPEAYTPSSTMLEIYEGPLDEIARQSELDHADIKDYTEIQYPGESWNYKKPSTLEKKEKKTKSPKKEKVEEPEEPETREIRLVARVKSEPEEEPVEPVKEKKPKKELFGFFHRSSKASSPTSESPEPAFEGPLDTTVRSDEFESIPFEHSEFTASTPIKAEQVVIEVPEEKKHSRFNWFARWRHEGDEDVVEKPSAYAFSSDIYDGPLEDLYPQGDVDQTLITEYADMYDYQPYRPKKPVREKVKTPEPEPTDVKLVARIPPMEPEERTSPVKDRPRLSSFNIFHRQSKQLHGYPEPTEAFTGDLEVTGRSHDVEKSPFDMRTDYPEYSPKVEPELPAEPPQQSRLHRLFARWRHEGEEDVVEKPDLYKFSSDVYDGPLEEIHPEGEVEQAPLQEHSEIYEYVEYRDGSKKPKSPKASKKVAEKESTPEPSETHEVKLLTRVKSEEPEEPEVQETTPSKPFRLRFLSLAKKTQDSEYPETSPVYEGPLDLTSRSDEMEPMPYLHGATPRYSPKITPVKRKTPEPTVEKKKYRLIARLRHDGDEDTVEKPEAYGHSTEVYDGELEETHKKQEVEQVPLGEYSDITKKEADKKTVRLVARVPPQQDSEPKKPASKFRLFPLSKSSSSSKGYPATSPTYEGPMDVTGRVKPLDHVPLKTREIPAYSPRKSIVSEEKVPEEPKRYRLIARFKHEGDEDVVEKPEGYTPSSKMLEPYEGPFDEISRSSEVEQTSLRGIVDVKYDVETFKVEKRQKKKRSEVPDASDSDEQEMEPKSRFSFLRTQKPRSQVTSYPSSSYSGPLDTTNLNMDLENIPLTIPEPIIEKRVPRKYRLIHRHRHAGEEDEVAARHLHPAFYSFPVTRYSGEMKVVTLEEELPELPIRRFSKVYHSGSSATLIWNLLNARSSRASREMEGLKRTESKKEVKLIARVLPMKKTPEKEENAEKPTKEEQETVDTLTRSAELMDTSRTLTSTLNAINYIPSSLQYNPRPARIEGTTQDGDCYVEVRHERRAEVQLEPAYVLRETTARSHAYLSTATAVFSGVSSSSSGAQASSSATSHSLVLPSFVGSVSEDETGLHHFSWTPQQMSPQPERMSLLARLGFKRDKSKKKDKKKSNKKGENETSGETSDSEHDEKREFAVVEFEQHAPTHNKQDPSPPKKPEHRTQKSPGRRADEPMNEVTVVVTSSERPKELKNTKEVRHETREQQFRLTGDGYTSGFNPNDPSLMATIQRAERLNASSPRLEHAERTFTVRANAPLPVSFEESGQPYTTVSTWQETSDLPEQVEVYTDENGRQITRTVKSSQVKHTVQTQSFQNYIVDGDQVPVGVVDVERSREQLTPLGQKASSSSSNGANGAVAENGGDSSGIVETQTRTMTYEAQGGENAAPPGWAEQGLGEYVSSKSVTQGNRTIETITYKTEKDGVVETHVEHRVTIHSDGDIDHDAELSQAILEATQMNPDMVVEKIEVRQETTQ